LRETHTTSGGSNKEVIKVGDIVLIHDDCPRLKWRLAVVQELQRGNDGFVRSVIIRTDKGVTNRPISKLYPLEVNAGMGVSSSRAKDMVDDDNHVSDMLLPGSAELQSSPIPHRLAAVKARSRISKWGKILQGQEDVMD